MNVLQVPLRYYPESLGGVESYVSALSKQLHERGIGVTVAAPAETGAEYSHDGIPVVRFAENATRSRMAVARTQAEPSASAEFMRVLDRVNPDVVHLHAMSPLLSPALVREIKRRRVPVIFTSHLPGVVCARGTLLRHGTQVCDGVWDARKCTACMLQQKGLPIAVAALIAAVPAAIGRRLDDYGVTGRATQALRMRTRQAADAHAREQFLDAVDRIVAVSEWMREMLVANGVDEARILMCRHGATSDTHAPRTVGPRGSEAVLRVAFLGRLHWTKGAHILVDAISRRPRLPIQLDIFGIVQEDSPYVSRLMLDIQRDTRIRLLDPVKNDAVATRLQAYDVLAVPSQWLETGPLVVYDAFLAGIPVIGSRRGGLAELVTDGKDGLLVEPADPQEWAAALERLSGDRELLERLRAGVVPPRSMDAVAAEMLALYGTVAKL